MNISRFLLLLVCSLVAVSFTVSNWTFVESESGIDVYQRIDEQNNKKWFRLTTTIDYPMREILDYTGNVEKLPEWVYACKETRVLASKENEMSYYSVTDMPYPISDRDAIIRKVVISDEKNKTFTSISTNSREFDIQSDYVRVSNFEAIWFFEEINDQKTMVTYDIYVNPGDSLPDWIKDRIVKMAPMKTMINLKNKFALKH